MIRELSPDAYRNIHIAVHSLEEASIAVRLLIDTALDMFAADGKLNPPIHL
jgi:hypothetical protein